MFRAVVETIATSFESVSHSDGLPLSTIDPIDRHWLQRRSSEIIVVRSPTPDEDQWKSIGHILTSSGLTTNATVAIAVNGSFPITNTIEVMDRISHTNTRSNLVLEWRNIQHPVTPNIFVPELNMILEGNTSGMPWIGQMWQTINSMIFNEGCDMIVFFFNLIDAITTITNARSWSQRIARYLESADLWIIPMDENIGFFVGILRDTATSSALMKNLHGDLPDTTLL